MTEQSIIIQAYHANNLDVTATAAELGISAITVSKHLHDAGIKRKTEKRPLSRIALSDRQITTATNSPTSDPLLASLEEVYPDGPPWRELVE